jgi:hypothetical protein
MAGYCSGVKNKALQMAMRGGSAAGRFGVKLAKRVGLGIAGLTALVSLLFVLDSLLLGDTQRRRDS